MSHKIINALQTVRRRLFTAQSIPAWLLTVVALIRPVYSIVDAVSNLDFVLTARENPRVMAVLHFLTSPGGNLVLLLAGLGWLTLLALRPSKSSAVANDVALPASKSDTPKLAILLPQHKWHIGSRFTILGTIFPPESGKVQLLIQPAGEAWELFTDVQVFGPTWVRNHRFEDASYYRIVAVYGDSLKQRFYDEPPATLIKSEQVAVYRRQHEQDFVVCPDKQLHQTKIDDKSAIKDMLIVAGIQYRKMDEGPEPTRIDFGVVILNMSLHAVSVESISGYVSFFEAESGKTINFELPPKLKKSESAWNIGFRHTGYFVVQQDFQTTDEADFFLNRASPDSLFQFKTLSITFGGEELEAITLAPDISFRKKDGQWVARDEMDFIYVRLLSDPRAALEEINSKHAVELDETLANCRSRLKRIEKLSEVRGRATQLLHEFNDPQRPTPSAIKYWGELLEKALYECYGAEGVAKFDDNRGYPVKAPEAEKEHSNWLYMNWLRLEDLIKAEYVHP